MQKGTKRNLFVAATYAVVLFLGILLGQNYNVQNRQNQPVPAPILPIGMQEHASKVQRALDLISGNYVDSINMDSLQNAIINEMLSRLDPHSDYMEPQDAALHSQSLEGSFEGIGVEYFVLNDTVLVVGLVPRGPAQQAGVKVGDRMLSIDGVSIAGVQVTLDRLGQLIRGKKGSTVETVLQRQGVEETVLLKIIRDQYEVSSIDAAYLLTPTAGYLRISNFGARTVQDARQQIQILKRQGAEDIILDLRGNRGGFLAAGIDLAGLFLPAGNAIVYTEGTHDPRTTYTARDGGQFTDMGLVVLIDEASASASEIVAGAIQDYKRGPIIGRRSFGKGLIQERFGFGDGSVMNLTVARYYTPLGRSIQRPFREGQSANNGQILFVEGGIKPDIEVAVDSAEYSSFYQKVSQEGWLHEFVYSRLTTGVPAFAIESFLKGYYLADSEYEAFLDFVKDKGVDYKPSEERSLKQRMSLEIESLLARYYFGSDAYFKTKNRRDQVINAALARLEVQNAVEGIRVGHDDRLEAGPKREP